MLSMLNNGKIHLKSANSLCLLPHELSIIMTTKTPGIEHFFYIQMFIPGFSIFIIPVQIFFLSGSTIGGFG